MHTILFPLCFSYTLLRSSSWYTWLARSSCSAAQRTRWAVGDCEMLRTARAENLPRDTQSLGLILIAARSGSEGWVGCARRRSIWPGQTLPLPGPCSRQTPNVPQTVEPLPLITASSLPRNSPIPPPPPIYWCWQMVASLVANACGHQPWHWLSHPACWWDIATSCFCH